VLLDSEVFALRLLKTYKTSIKTDSTGKYIELQFITKN